MHQGKLLEDVGIQVAQRHYAIRRWPNHTPQSGSVGLARVLNGVSCQEARYDIFKINE